MAGDKFACMKVVILVHFISYLVLVRGDGELDFIQERLQRLEERFLEKIAKLETRFAEDTAFMETRFAEDIALLRRELHHGLTTVPEIAESVNVDGRPTCTNREPRVSDCSEWRYKGYTTSGIYTVFLEKMWRPLKVYCDMETDGGGWTVFQRRMDGSVDFYRNWMNYTLGFGNLSGEFWLGNEYVNRMSSDIPCELRIDMEDFEDDKRVAKYGLFSVGKRAEGYVLSVDYFTGNVSDSFLRGHNKQFSTYDAGPSSTCSEQYKGGWWYADCHYANLNGLYHAGEHESHADGINWYHWKGYYYSLKKTEMKFRPR